ncbi:MAG: 6-pyruvoyl-tetrahydropterin synthase-related protein [Candidatus Bathyarchaeia archaeon]
MERDGGSTDTRRAAYSPVVSPPQSVWGSGLWRWILSIIALNVTVAVFATQIFSQGYPLGMDTFSHLPKVLYLEKLGLASWYYDWYAGFPLFLFYPPLSYLLAYMPISMGVDGLLSYKVVEFIFLMVTPLVFYWLCRVLRMGRTQSLCATLIFGLIPSTVVNSVMFGRYPNIVSYPFFIATVAVVVGLIQHPTKRGMVLASTLFSLTLFMHHLSAYALALVIFIFAFGALFERTTVRQALTRFLSATGSLGLGVIISSVWIVPFLLYLRYYSGVGLNPLVSEMAPLAVLGFTAFIVGLHYMAKRVFRTINAVGRSTFVWMVSFILLGTYWLPVDYLLPFAGEVDLMRFQLFAAVPVAIWLMSIRQYPWLKVKRLLWASFRIQKVQVLVIVLLLANVAVGGAIFQYQPTIVAQQVYVDEPPQPVLEYLKSSEDYGRVLPIEVPYWVYLVPTETGKPLIDGWYPQGNLLKPVKSIRETLDTVNDDNVYRLLIRDADRFGVKWVLLGNSSRLYLFAGTHFTPVVVNPPYILLENEHPIPYVETSTPSHVEWTKEKDTIRLTLITLNENATVTVKEAFFPGWMATDNSDSLSLDSNDIGFIQFTVRERGVHEIILQFDPYEEILRQQIENVTRTLGIEPNELLPPYPRR